jgi:NAD(P)-dependent dehydrogenase (short-subunit alcohol dehydrogenase family)
MSRIEASQLLRPALLQETSILLARAPAADERPALADAVADACVALGARVFECQPGLHASSGLEEPAVEHALQEALERVLADAAPIDMLVVDGAGLFAHVHAGAGAEGGRPEAAREALRACLDASWNVTRAVANHAFLAGERGGRIVYLAPSSDLGEHAGAARAGLENLARTLSIEWARHRITAVVISPGAVAGTSAGEVAVLTAYLASPAGAYFSGCLLDLTGPGGG